MSGSDVPFSSGKHVSERRLAANRANAKKSTGPRTPEGKARSSMNGLLHGLSAKRLLLPNENPRAYNRFAEAMRDDLCPCGALETVLVERAIEAAWKLRRAGLAQRDVVLHALARYVGTADEITPGRLLADALAGDPRAVPYLDLDRYTEQLQRSFFTALRRLHAAKKLTLRVSGEANFGGFGAGDVRGASMVGLSDYDRSGGRQTCPTPVAGTETEPKPATDRSAPGEPGG